MNSGYRLVMKKGPNPGQVFELDGTEFSIGRDINNDIVINDAEMSRKHAKVYVYGQGFVVEDLGSTNGTFVNGQRLTGIFQLAAGDVISFGENSSCSFEVPEVDPDATRVSAQTPPYAAPMTSAPSMPVQSQETFISAPPPPQYDPLPVQPNYAGGVPGSYPTPEKPKKKGKAWLIILIILLLVICCCIIFWVIIDSQNMYCDLAPGIMNSVFGKGSCP